MYYDSVIEYHLTVRTRIPLKVNLVAQSDDYQKKVGRAIFGNPANFQKF